MSGFAARFLSGWLVLGLALVITGAAQARPSSDQKAGAPLGALGAGGGLSQAVQSNRQAATSGNKIRVTVRKGFVAINAANKKLYACTWGSCTNAGRTLRKAAQHWLALLRPLRAETKTVARGLSSAKTSLTYWAKTGLDAINADKAAKAKKQARFDYWYKRYKADYKLGVKYQNRAVNLLSQG